MTIGTLSEQRRLSMLGMLRYLLAMMVACSHFWTGLMWWQGTYAVFFFYVISGYLMTLVLNETYTGRSGNLRYLINRALRIYPLYLAVLGLSLALLVVQPLLGASPLDVGLHLRDVLRQPTSGVDWFANLTLLPPWESGNLTVSQAWSLRIELFFYVLLLLLARSRPLVLVWFTLSVLAVCWQESAAVAFFERYTGILGSSIAFSLGSLVFHFRDRLRLPFWQVPAAVILFGLHTWFAADIWAFDRDAGFAGLFRPASQGLYANALLGAYLLAAIVAQRRGSGSLARIGTRLGELAYPVFLVHWFAAGVLLAAGVSFQDKPTLLLSGFLLVNVLAVLLHYGVEAPVNRTLRAAVRRGDMSLLRRH